MRCETCEAPLDDYPIMITFTIRVRHDDLAFDFFSRKIETVYVCSAKCGAKFLRRKRDAR